MLDQEQPVQPPEPVAAQSHVQELRSLMMEQLRALRRAEPGEALTQELKRSRGVSELSQTVINSAKVEVEYLAVLQGDGEVPFFAAPDEGSPGLTNGAKAPAGPLLGGPGEGHPWRTSVVHKLKG